jgi:maltose O-acetyltransferase
MAVERGMKVGRNVQVQRGVQFDVSHAWLIEIGDDVTLAPFSYLLAHDASTKQALGFTKIGRVTIGDGAFIGARALITPGVRIGRNAVVAAGAIVTRDVAEGTIVAGNPARPVGETREMIERNRNLLASRPKWAADGWTWPLPPQAQDDQRAALADGCGFVE